MNENILKYGIPIVAVIVVLYLISKMSKGGKSTTTTINRLVPVGENNTSSPQNRDPSRVAAFSNLATVAGQQISSKAQEQSEAKQFAGLQLQKDFDLKALQNQFDIAKLGSESQYKLAELAGGLQLQGLQSELLSGQEIERIKAGIQRELGLQQLEAITRQIAGQQESERIQSADRRYDVESQLRAVERMYQSQENLFTQQAKSAYDMLLAQINAVQSVGQQYRNQSLERQGTILNALASVFKSPAPYDYMTAFGGPKPPGFFQGLFNTISNIAQSPYKLF